MKLENFIQLLESDVFETLDSGTLKPETKFVELEEWDSLIVLSLIAMVDTEFGVNLNVDEINASENIDQLFKLIQKSK